MVDRASEAQRLRQEKREKESSLELRKIRALEEIADALESIRGDIKLMATTLPHELRGGLK